MEAIPLGILVDRSVIRAALTGNPSHEDVRLYWQVAPCPVCFFSLADLGLDLAFTADGPTWFLEANSRQMRRGLRVSGQLPQYRDSHRLPLVYGHALLSDWLKRSLQGQNTVF